MRAVARLALLGITFFSFFFSLDFQGLWRSVMSITLFTEVKRNGLPDG